MKSTCKACLLFILFSVSFHLKAFEYKYSGAHQNIFNQKIYFYSKILNEIGFEPQYESHFGDLPIVKVDQVFEDQQSRALIFLKIGLEVNKSDQHRLIKLNDFYVYHFDNVALAFFNSNESHAQYVIQKFKNNMNQKLVSQGLYQWFNFSAHANTDCDNKNIAQARELDQLSETSKGLSMLAYSKEFAQCAFNEIKESVGNKLDVENFFNNFSFNPAQMWEEIKKQYDGLKSISNLFSQEFLDFTKNISVNFSEDEKVKMTCLMGKTMGPSLPTMLIGAGAGVAFIELFSSILPKFVKFSEMLTKLKSLPKSKNLVNAGLSCGI